MTITVILLIAALIFIVAVLYSTVGHAGASGYLAAMALFGVAPAVMKPTALMLNIIVAVVGTIRFCRAGFFSWRTFWPFAAASIPAAFIGGWLTLPASIYKAVVGVVLLYSAVRIFFSAKRADQQETHLPPNRRGFDLGRGHWTPFRPHRRRWWNLPESAAFDDGLGEDQGDFRCLRHFHSRQLDRGAGGARVVC
jgi:uncharacterized membrane protein YfcA